MGPAYIGKERSPLHVVLLLLALSWFFGMCCVFFSLCEWLLFTGVWLSQNCIDAVFLRLLLYFLTLLCILIVLSRFIVVSESLCAASTSLVHSISEYCMTEMRDVIQDHKISDEVTDSVEVS